MASLQRNPTLTSHHPQAQSCHHDPFPNEEGAFVLLQDIGSTAVTTLKHRMHWLEQCGHARLQRWLGVPVLPRHGAKGFTWIETGAARCCCVITVSEPMKAVAPSITGVSVIASDSNGNPTGARTYLPASQWRYYEIIGTDIM